MRLLLSNLSAKGVVTCMQHGLCHNRPCLKLTLTCSLWPVKCALPYHNALHLSPCFACVQKRLLPKAADTKDENKDNKQSPQQEHEVVDLRDLTRQQRQMIVDNALATHEQSNEVLLEKYAARAET